jgi:osmotically-inducible protein OsmY
MPPLRLSHLPLVLALCGWIAGCSVYRVYAACGLRGCPGDAEITTAVRQLFHAYPVLEPPNLLDVQTLDRVVYLRGLVDTDTQREMAGSVAGEATGVARVVNLIGLSGNR